MSDILSSRGATNNKQIKIVVQGKGLNNMRCNKRSAEARYRMSRNMIVLILACIAVFVAITIKDLVTGSPLSASTSAFIASATCTLSLNIMNMRKAKAEMR